LTIRINVLKKHVSHRGTHKCMRRSRCFLEKRARDVYLANRRLRPSRIYIIDLHVDDTERKTETRSILDVGIDPPNSSSSIYYKTRIVSRDALSIRRESGLRFLKACV